MKIGDYVRTKNKGIFKIDERCYFNKDFKEFWFKAPCDYGNEWTTTREVIKSSPNIIDLLEENDLVKIEYFSPRYEERVTRLFEVYYKDNKFMNFGNRKCEFMLVNNEFSDDDKRLNPIIKSIVTKESFKEMEYEVK